jgi:hypothetical protein
VDRNTKTVSLTSLLGISIVPVTFTVLLYTQYKYQHIVPCPTAWNFFTGPMIVDLANCIT